MNHFKRILCLLALLVLIVQCVTAEGFDFSGSSEIPVSDITDTGHIRVYLASLGDPEAMLITLAGEYAVNASDAMRFDRGTQLALAADGDSIYMYAGGVTLNMGSEFTLTRCAAEDGAENGLYIYESEKDALYEGDLHIRCSGGRLIPILTISMEDYLCGVVAYEMSDSFPLEALKAQAVAARTYAMSRKVARAAKDYDVTDTTTDQVFKGFVGDYVSVVRAVEETDGVVGTYNGGYATCYYTASNGGQVATPGQIWGGDGDYGYIEQKDDPYDLQNGRSMVNSFEVPVRYSPDNLLWQMIEKRVHVTGCTEYRLDDIVSVNLAEPAFDGSYMYRTAEFEVGISVRNWEIVEVEFDGNPGLRWVDGMHYVNGRWYRRVLSDWERLPGTQKVTFDVYEELKDTLGIGLNSRDYEIFTVELGEENCVLEMRRFGHGVGMSQRGAQVMAGEYGFDYTEILAFYYPGMMLERIDWIENPLPELDELPEAIITERLLIPPAEGDLGELQKGEYYARVQLESSGSRLNVRALPTTDAAVVAKLDSGYRLVVIEETDDGWAHVRAARFTGYVKLDYIVAE